MRRILTSGREEPISLPPYVDFRPIGVTDPCAPQQSGNVATDIEGFGRRPKSLSADNDKEGGK